MPRGNAFMREWEKTKIAERDSQPIVARCAHCDWTLEAQLGETRDAYTQHRQHAHPEIQPAKRRQRYRPVSQISRAKTLDQNIASVREQGGATWDGATL